VYSEDVGTSVATDRYEKPSIHEGSKRIAAGAAGISSKNSLASLMACKRFLRDIALAHEAQQYLYLKLSTESGSWQHIRIHHMNTQRPDEELAGLMSDG
jgi:hypothetical protein